MFQAVRVAGGLQGGNLAQGRRWIQQSIDDRIPPAEPFDYIVRRYDPNGPLSRHMNPEIEALLLKFEEHEQLPPITQQQWNKWQSDIQKGVTLTSIRFCNYVGDEVSERKKDRKVTAEFHPLDLGVSEAAAEKMRQIVGQRYDSGTGKIRLVSRSLPTSAANQRRVTHQVSQLIYYSSVLAGDIQPASPPAEEAAASASESS